MRYASVLRLFAFSASIYACGATEGGLIANDGTDSGTGAPGDAAGADAGCEAAYPASQGASQPCCITRGPDACGAGLFCAAFDGRQQPTCYQEHSRQGGQACSAAVQCASSVCADGICTEGDGGVTSDAGFKDAGAAKDASTPKDAAPTDSGHKQCILPCSTNLECQNTCPTPNNGINCCDPATSVCYATNQSSCPI